MFALAVRVEDGVDVGGLLTECLAELEMQHKEAWLACGMQAPDWSRALKGDAPLDLWKLRLLPVRVWQRFIPKLSAALILHWWADMTGDLRMARVRPESKQEKRA